MTDQKWENHVAGLISNIFPGSRFEFDNTDCNAVTSSFGKGFTVVVNGNDVHVSNREVHELRRNGQVHSACLIIDCAVTKVLRGIWDG